MLRTPSAFPDAPLASPGAPAAPPPPPPRELQSFRGALRPRDRDKHTERQSARQIRQRQER
eukprot:9119714-Alexandrium_andersonii.AAC.1